MNQLPTNKKYIYVLNDRHMAKLDDLISEMGDLFCEIFSSRGLSVTSGLEVTPMSGLINAVVENGLSMDDVTKDS